MEYHSFCKKDFIENIVIALVVVITLALISYPYIIWTDRNLEYFLSYLKDQEIKVPFWISTVVVLVSNVLGLIFNIVCYLVKL